MKKTLLLYLVFILCGGILLAQKYQPKYLLREDNKPFKDLQTSKFHSLTFKRAGAGNSNDSF